MTQSPRSLRLRDMAAAAGAAALRSTVPLLEELEVGLQRRMQAIRSHVIL